MRPRDSNIPLFLWVATAILAHLAWGGGANQVSRLIEERLDIRRFAVAVEQIVRLKNQTVEVALLDNEPARPPLQKDETSPEAAPSAKPVPDRPRPEPAQKPEPATEPSKEKPPELKSKERPPEKKPEPKQAEPKKPEPKKEETPAKPPEELPKIVTPNRIAVRQHVDDKNQKDNPNAEFIGDEANKVAEQTQARVTSTDQNDKNPTPAAHPGADKTPGDSSESRVAQSEDRPGAPDRAPNEGTNTREKAAAAAAQSGSAATRAQAAATNDAPAGQKGTAQASKSQEPADPGQKAESQVNAQDAVPETANSERGSFAVGSAQQSITGQKAKKGRRKHLPPLPNRGPLDMLGLGALGTTAGGVNLNLSPRMAFAAVGQDKLARERKADAERRKSAHRGSWQPVGIERWRSAIENYVSSVKPGNQTALNTARVPFASYLNQIHNRLHPIFADSFLASLDHLPGSHPMNRSNISTNLEIVLDQQEGRIVRMGVTKTSGVTAFDIAALESVQRAQPFGMPPREIVSPDGNVYFHWEFYRDPFYACSTYFARPYLLKVKPKTAPPELPAPKPRPYDPSEPADSDQTGRLGAVDRSLVKQRALR